MKIISNSYKIFFSAILFLIALSMNLQAIAQEKAKSSPNDKIKSINGDISKIVITADGKETIFEGEEAAKLFKRLQPVSKKRVKIMVMDDDDFTCLDNDDVMIFHEEGEDGKDIKIHMKKFDDDFEWIEKGDKKVRKEIKAEVTDGKKKVTITTQEDGEKKVEVLEGEAAEKFLQEHEVKSEHRMKLHDKDGKEMKIFKKKIEKE